MNSLHARSSVRERTRRSKLGRVAGDVIIPSGASGNPYGATVMRTRTLRPENSGRSSSPGLGKKVANSWNSVAEGFQLAKRGNPEPSRFRELLLGPHLVIRKSIGRATIGKLQALDASRDFP